MQKTIIGYWCQQRKLFRFLFVFLSVCLLNSCFKSDGIKIVSSDSNVVVKKVRFSSLSGWNKENFKEIIPVFRKNCEHLMKNKGEYIYSSVIKVKSKDINHVCEKFFDKKITDGKKMKRFIESEFIPYAVLNGNNDEGKFTSYYEATINASFEKNSKYKYPIYGKPNDLVETNLKDFDDKLPNVRLVGLVKDGKFIPYFDREYIEKNGIDAPILMWGDDLVDIHFMQIQGSAVAKMNDGSEVRIGFADSNGKKFRGIGSVLLEKGLLKPGEVSMPKIRSWLKTNKGKAQKEMAENKRFIFHRIIEADGPIGAMGVSLTAGRSLAVDNAIVPLGVMMWLDTYSPDNDDIEKIVFAQDIGSAIKGVVRGDYFWGHGEDALLDAGRMNSKGKYFILAPKYSALEVN